MPTLFGQSVQCTAGHSETQNSSLLSTVNVCLYIKTNRKKKWKEEGNNSSVACHITPENETVLATTLIQIFEDSLFDHIVCSAAG